MFGRGRVENVAALVSAMIIIFVMALKHFERLYQNYPVLEPNSRT